MFLINDDDDDDIVHCILRSQ